MTYRDLEPAIARIGGQLHAEARRRRSARQRTEDRLIDLLLGRPAARARLFQLVDAFPALRGPADVAEHITAYLDHESFPAPLRRLVHAAHRVPGGDRASASLARHGITAMASRFIAGTDMADAAGTFRRIGDDGMGLIVDLLGERTITQADADRYAERVSTVLRAMTGPDVAPARRSIAVKPTALSPRFRPLTSADGLEEARRRLVPILGQATDAGVQVWLDMEQNEVKDMTISLFRSLVPPGPAGGRAGSAHGDRLCIGLVIQAYLRDSGADLRDLLAWAADHRGAGSHGDVAVRLVKGAYWDAETVVARAHGWPVPVYEHKADTDANYERCTRLLLEHEGPVTPAFASHNVRSIAHAIAVADTLGRSREHLRFQMLHGMEGGLAGAVRSLGPQVEIYAPIGELVPGMAYLVRRLLENSSNESFVRQRSGGVADMLGAPRPRELAA